MRCCGGGGGGRDDFSLCEGERRTLQGLLFTLKIKRKILLSLHASLDCDESRSDVVSPNFIYFYRLPQTILGKSSTKEFLFSSSSQR